MEGKRPARRFGSALFLWRIATGVNKESQWYQAEVAQKEGAWATDSITHPNIHKYGSFGPDTRDDSDFILERHVSHSHLSLRHPYHVTAVLAFSQKCAWSPMEPRPSSWQSAQSLCEDIRRWQADKPHSNGEEDNDTKMGWKCADIVREAHSRDIAEAFPRFVRAERHLPRIPLWSHTPL
ncbi:hypothetical protein B0H14DRAFT_3167775, partial [Mycena olivaceomarginata]